MTAARWVRVRPTRSMVPDGVRRGTAPAINPPLTVCPCGRVAVPLVRPTHLAGLCDWCAAVVCDDPGYDVCTPTEWDDE